MVDRKQWVNLPKERRFVEGDIQSLDELGAVSYAVNFRNGEPVTLRVDVNEDQILAGNAYTAEELARHSNFHVRHQRPAVQHRTNVVRAMESVTLPAAGGNRYSLRARAGGRTVASTSVETWRKLYYDVIKVRGLAIPDLRPMEVYFRELFVKLQRVGPDIEIDAEQYVLTDSDAPQQRVNEILQTVPRPTPRERYHPWSFGILFVRNLARPVPQEDIVDVTSDRATIEDHSLGTGIRLQLQPGRYIAGTLEPSQEQAEPPEAQFEPGSCQLLEGDVTHPIPDENVSHSERMNDSSGAGQDVLFIRLPPDLVALARGGGTRIRIVPIVTGGLGGFSHPSENLIVVATHDHIQSLTEARPDASLRAIVTHELGHKIGMVPGREPLLLDAGLHLYEGRGHRGPHCERDMVFTAGAEHEWDGIPGCNMFGASRARRGEEWHDMPDRFCWDCHRQARKQELDARLQPEFGPGQR